MTVVTRKKLSDYAPALINPNAGSERGLAALEDSLQYNGFGRSMLASADGQMIAGSHTLEALVASGFDDVLEIETDGTTAVVLKRVDLKIDDPRARALQIADNRANEVGYVPNADVIGDLLRDIQAQDAALLAGTGYNAGEITALLDTPALALNDLAEDEDLTQQDVPKAVWPTDNDYEIPLLDLNLQANAADVPISIWGETARSSRMSGTWLFYTEDYRYEALWKDPSGVINSKCVTAAEPNFSCYGQTPFAEALWMIYRKRWLARYWQSCGIRIFADLNVNEKYAGLNMHGIPQGWKAYATRGYNERLEATEAEYALACERAGTSSILFLVYGGGKAVKERAKQRGWLHVDEIMKQKEKRGQR